MADRFNPLDRDLLLLPRRAVVQPGPTPPLPGKAAVLAHPRSARPRRLSLEASPVSPSRHQGQNSSTAPLGAPLLFLVEDRGEGSPRSEQYPVLADRLRIGWYTRNMARHASPSPRQPGNSPVEPDNPSERPRWQLAH